MRSAAAREGKDPNVINPVVPVDLVIDHSVQVDDTSTEGFKEMPHWSLNATGNGTNFYIGLKKLLRTSASCHRDGHRHEVNLEYLSHVVMTKEVGGETFVFPEIVVGTDSHTTMINGLGVVGWGVGGIEAIAAMLGQPLEIVTPDVIGFRLTGKT